MKKEYIIAGIISLFILLLVNLPFLYFLFVPKPDLIFLGRKVVNSQDTYTYVSFIEQAKQGQNLFENLYTNEPQTPSLFRISYLFIGKTAALLNISSILAYHLARIILIIIFFYFLYRFLSLFFTKSFERLIAFTVILIASGFGFLFSGFSYSSDLWIPESNTFASLGEAPHFILAQILMLIGFLYFLSYIAKGKKIYLFISALSFLWLSFEHPYNLLVIIPVVFFTSLLSRISLMKSFFITSCLGLGLVVQYVITSTNSQLMLWFGQNVLPSPSPLAYAVGFGFIGIFAVIGFLHKRKEKNPQMLLIFFWVLFTIIGLYAPVLFQRRLSEGMHIPIAILAVFGMLHIASYIKSHVWQKIALFSFIGLLLITTVVSVYRNIFLMNQDSLQSGYYYHISPNDQEGVAWLKQHTTQQDVILSNWFYGNIIPGITGRKVFLGHSIQTINFPEKAQEIQLLSQSSNSTVEKFLDDNGITYIFLGVDDPLLLNKFNPNKSFLKKVYSSRGISIYKVIINQ